MFIPKPMYFYIMILCSSICAMAIVIFLTGLIKGLMDGKRDCNKARKGKENE